MVSNFFFLEKYVTGKRKIIFIEYQENLKVTAIVEKRNKKEIQDLKFVVNEKSRHIQSLEEVYKSNCL